MLNRKMLKRLRLITAPLCAGFLALGLLAGCGSDAPPSNPVSQPTTAPKATEDTPQKAASPKPAKPNLSPAQMQLVRGRKVYAKCKACHTLEQGAPARIGPNLYGIFGQTAGHHDPEFNYSTALKNSGFVWTDETMDTYLEKPMQAVPGTRMSFIGLKKPTDRAAVIAYLHEQTDPK